MVRLSRVTARQIIRVIEGLGFKLSRQNGSHKIYQSSTGKRATVPFHDNKILHPKILKAILRDVELSASEFERLL